MSKQYYYRVDGCPAIEYTDADCICWHDQGTGPFPKATDQDDKIPTNWREKGADHE